jgi:acetyl esterase/lipase
MNRSFAVSVAAAVLAAALCAGQAKKAVEDDGPKPDSKVFKTTADAKGQKVELSLFIFNPANHKPADKRPVIVFFFGGGWVGGSPSQFYPQARHFAARGMVAICADYRIKSKHDTTPFECVADGKSAIRFVRANAAALGVDPERVVASGGSAGGHVAACTGVVPGLDEKRDDAGVSSVPNVMVLFNPVLDTTPTGFGAKQLGDRAKEISPLHHVRAKLPPTLVLHGKADKTVPFTQAEAFQKTMQDAANRCELFAFDGGEHGFFNFGRPGGGYEAALQAADQFLVSLKYLPEAK